MPGERVKPHILKGGKYTHGLEFSIRKTVPSLHSFMQSSICISNRLMDIGQFFVLQPSTIIIYFVVQTDPALTMGTSSGLAPESFSRVLVQSPALAS